MKNLILKEFKINYKNTIFWSLGFISLIIIGFAEYEMLKNSLDNMSSIINSMPRIVQIMMGIVLPIETPEGYFACMQAFVCLGAYLHATLLGSNIITKEERDKTSEFIFSKPINRSQIITCKLIVAKTNVIFINLVIWLTTFLVFSKNLSPDLIKTINLCMLGMLITQFVFLFTGFLLSALPKENNKSSIYSAILVFITYFISIIILIMENIEFLRFLTPFLYFDTVSVMDNGLSTTYIVTSIIISILTLIVGYRLWNKRDLKS